MISRTILDTHNQNCPSTRAKRQRVVDREHVRLERVFTNYVLLAEEESVSVFSRRSQISRRDRGRPVASPPVIDSRWNARPRCCCFGQINEPLIRFPTVSLQVGKSQLAARMGSADWVETRVDWYDSFRVASPSFPLSLSRSRKVLVVRCISRVSRLSGEIMTTTTLLLQNWRNWQTFGAETTERIDTIRETSRSNEKPNLT